MILDHSKISLSEMLCNSKGKTSAMLFCGFVGCMVASITFFSSSVFMFYHMLLANTSTYTSELQNMTMQSVAFFTVAAAMLTTRRFTADKVLSDEKNKNEIDAAQ
jgi:hypothetical protein